MTHASLHDSYRRGTDRRLFLLAATALVLLALALADLATGPSGMPLAWASFLVMRRACASW